MSLEKTHKEYVIENIHKKYLYSGVVPTAIMIQEDLAEYEKQYPDYRIPISKQTDMSIGHGGFSSAGKMEEIVNAVNDDFIIATKEVYNLAKTSQEYYDRWLADMKRLKSRLARLEQSIDTMLLLSNDSAGFYHFVGDTFLNMNFVDTSSTTAKVIVSENTVGIGSAKNLSVSNLGDLIDMSWLRETDVTFSPISLRNGISFAAETTGLTGGLANIFSNNNSRWVGKISSKTDDPMLAELKFDVSRDSTEEVSSIVLDYTGPNDTTKSNVTLQYSVDGYTWKIPPIDNATKVLTSNLAWNFPTKRIKSVKFIFYKPSSDSSTGKNGYDYMYSIESVRISGRTYKTTSSVQMLSSTLSVKDKEGKDVLFSKVALDTCEEVPADTDIKYYVRASKDNNTWTSWSAIEPTKRTTNREPKVITLSGANKKKTTDSDVVKFDTSKETRKATRTFGDTQKYSGYRFKDSSFSLINSSIDIDTEEDPNVISNTIKVWRNTVDKTGTYPDVSTVRGVQRGWNKSGGKYTCYFEISNSAGKVIDFGSRECELDGKKVSGIVNIKSGVHKFSTAEVNWVDIAPEYLKDIPGSDSKLKEIDPLYPHNHKLLIEGVRYSSGFSGEKKYTGTDISGESYATRKSNFDLENNSKSLEEFSVVSVGKTGQSLGVMIKQDNSYADNENELFHVTWQSGQTNATMYKYVKLKAVFSTADKSKTPSLSSYRIKLGL